ncbi:MAG: hypothetical protein MRY63_07150, partial [Neomegalonema sp.]|nr:hypothetical protein [Neomegalonema sp.]
MYEIVQPPYEAPFSTLLLFYPAETDNDEEKFPWMLRNTVSFDATGRPDKKSVESVSNTHAHAGTDPGQDLPDIIGHVSQNEGSIYLFRKKIVEFLIKSNCDTVTFIPAHYVRDDTNKKRAKAGEYFFAIL